MSIQNMKTSLLGVLSVLLFATAGSLSAGETVDKRLNVPTDGTVEIENMAGSIKVSGWDRDEVHVEGELDDNADGLKFVNNGGFTTVKVEYPRQRGGFWDGDDRIRGSDLQVMVPRSSRIVVSSVSADVDVSEVDGPLEVETISGSMNVFTQAVDITLESISGDIRLGEGADAVRANVETVSGDVRITGFRGDISASSVSGDIELMKAHLARGEFTNTSGDIEVSGAFAAGGIFRFKAISGDIDASFDTEPNGDFDITTFSGDIDNNFGPEPKKVSRYTPNQELKFRAGDGDGEFTFSSMSGDIDIRK